MTGPVRERIAAVYAARQGSGYLLTAKLILTAGHVVRDSARIQAAVPGGLGLIDCDLLWSGLDHGIDAALLRARKHLVPLMTSKKFSLTRWGVVNSLTRIPGCEAIGFPRAQRIGQGSLGSEQLVGTLKPGSGLLNNRYVLDSDHTPPTPRPDGGSPWAGMSGAALFAQDLLLGVVAFDPAGWQHGRVEAVPTHLLLNDSGFHEALGRDAPGQYSIITVQPTVDPDAEFQQRYADYLAAKHGTLTIFGIDLTYRSRATWPLDAAYLSLEAAASETTRDFPGTNGGPLHAPSAPLPADQALAGRERVLLRGVAGSGKTTLVQWLATTAARHERGDKIPFVLPLRTLVRHGPMPMPDDFLPSVRVPITAPTGWAERILTGGRGLLLIDGVDEIPEAERERVRTWLHDLLIAFPGNEWLITSRPSAVTNSWLTDLGFAELTLSPMSRDDVAAFITRWHDAARSTADDPEERTQLDTYQSTLLTAVRTKQDLARLATNPLMCGLICALHRDRHGYLPHGRKELYDAALSMLLARRDRERDIAVHLTEEPQIQLLQRLAYWLIRNGQAEMDQSDALDLITAALPSMPSVAAQGDAPVIFRHLLIRSGLLREPSDGSVDFIHRTFQDYLGAKAAVEERDFDLMVRNAHHDQWEDVLRMAVAHARPAERARLLRKLIARGDKVKAHRTRLHLLAMACLEHATELDPAARGEVESRAAALIPPRNEDEANALAAVGPVVLDLLPGPEHLEDDEAEAVVITAARIGTDAALPVLARYCEHRHFGLRAQLASSWSRFDTGQYVTDVLSHLSRDDGLSFYAQSHEELRALGAMADVTRVHVRGAFHGSELVNALKDSRISKLSIADNLLFDDLSYLRQLPLLGDLALVSCPAVTDLLPLSDLPLHSLNINGPAEQINLDGLGAITTLKSLALIGRWPADILTSLPHHLPLASLHLPSAAGGLEVLAAWPSLITLGFADRDSVLNPDDWAHVFSLPNLAFLLFADHTDHALFPPGMTSHRVTTLVLNRLSSDAHIRNLSAVLPGLQRLYLNAASGAFPTIDLAPLAALPDLQTLTVSHPGTVLNAHLLPSTVKLTLRPRPRQ